MLRRVSSFLEGLAVDLPPLIRYDDWWEHDGLHFERGRLTFRDLWQIAQTARSLLNATPDDHAVFIGIAPEDNRWYLRFRVEWDEDDNDIVGRFTVIVPSDIAERFRNEVVPRLPIGLEEAEARQYYEKVVT